MEASKVQINFLIGFLLLISIHSIKSSAVNNTTEISSRIINGAIVTSGTAFPWHATLSIQGKFFKFCGGSLIHPRWILTAAHCLDGSTSLTATLGTIICNSQNGVTFTVASTAYYVNPSYNSVNLANDIALIKLPNPVTLSPTQDVVKLYPRAKCCSTTTVNNYDFSGCGTINGPAMPLNLRSTSLTGTTDLQCIATYPGLAIGTMCAVSSISNTCIDDDGGALVLRSTPPYQVGVLSFSAASCTSSVVNTRSRFIKVCMYHDWIQAITGVNLG